MNITYQCKKGDPKRGTQEYAEKKVAKLERFFPEDESLAAKIVVRMEKLQARVELTVTPRKGPIYRADIKGHDDDPYAAIDSAVEAIEGQIRKTKTKWDKRRRSGAAIDSAAADTAQAEVEEDEYKIVRTKLIAIKPMSPQEAIEQMELLGHSFYCFRDSDSGNFAVVYSRENGDYGLIEQDSKYEDED